MHPVDLGGLAVFNLVEAAVWLSFGVGLLLASIRRPLGYRIGRFAGVGFVLFGLSDLVEMSTGAWYRPWWLLMWKALCVVALASAFLRYRRLLRTSEAPRQ